MAYDAMMKFGFGMQGMEQQITDITQEIAERFDEVTYIEIGVAEGTTLTAVASILAENSKKWRAVGIELPDGYSFNHEKNVENAQRRNLPLHFVIPDKNVKCRWNKVTIYLKDSKSFLTEIWKEPIHLALIDGCHGKPCVMQDFLALDPFMVPGGIIMFHDFGLDQIGHPQPHCPSGVDVRGACNELGLLNGNRTSWKFRGDITADKVTSGWDMGIFIKDADSPNS